MRGSEVFSIGGDVRQARRLPTKACKFLAGVLDGWGSKASTARNLDYFVPLGQRFNQTLHLGIIPELIDQRTGRRNLEESRESRDKDKVPLDRPL